VNEQIWEAAAPGPSTTRLRRREREKVEQDGGREAESALQYEPRNWDPGLGWCESWIHPSIHPAVVVGGRGSCSTNHFFFPTSSRASGAPPARSAG
jgi:hypothetical protein